MGQRKVFFKKGEKGLSLTALLCSLPETGIWIGRAADFYQRIGTADSQMGRMGAENEGTISSQRWARIFPLMTRYHYARFSNRPYCTSTLTLAYFPILLCSTTPRFYFVYILSARKRENSASAHLCNLGVCFAGPAGPSLFIIQLNILQNSTNYEPSVIDSNPQSQLHSIHTVHSQLQLDST